MNDSTARYHPETLAPAEIAALRGPLVLEFGTDWCGHCRRAAPLIDQALERHPRMPHVKIEDGPGRPLGRSFQVKLWPTVVFLNDGEELTRLVRPTDAESVHRALDGLAPR